MIEFLHTIFVFFIAGSSLIIGLFVLSRSYKSPVNQSFFFLTASISTWCFGFGMLALTGQFGLFDKVSLYGGLMAVFGFFLFTNIFPNKVTISNWLWLSLTPVIFVSLIIPFNLVMTDVLVHGFMVMPINGQMYFLYGGILILYIILGSIQIVQTYRNVIGIERTRMRYFATSLVVSLIIAVTANVALPAFDKPEFNVVGFGAVLFFLGATAYAIVQHNLMDIRIVIQRSMIYTLVLVLFLGIYFGLLYLVQYIFRISFTVSPAISAGLTVVVYTFSASWIKDKFKRATDSIFFKGLYDYQQAVHDLSMLLYVHNTPQDLVFYCEKKLESLLRASFVSIVKDGSVESRMVDIAVPIVWENTHQGVILVGPKLSGDMYTNQDKVLLETFSYQAALAFEKARLYSNAERYSKELENIVSERTQKIRDLQQSQEDMIVDIAHNLQTPLSVIKNELAVIRKSFKQKYETLIFEKSIDRLSQFMYRLLRLARLRTVVSLDSLEIINFSELVSESVEYFRVVGSANCHVVRDSIEPEIFIKGNSVELEECFANIVSNAFKYSKKNVQSFVDINLSQQKDYVILQIIDNGSGIKDLDTEKIFDRMYRSKDVRVKGTGLGLAICKRVVERHGGSIKVSSRFGKGTAFTLSFPVYKENR